MLLDIRNGVHGADPSAVTAAIAVERIDLEFIIDPIDGIEATYLATLTAGYAALGVYSSISGGDANLSNGNYSSINGGQANMTPTLYDSVLGK